MKSIFVLMAGEYEDRGVLGVYSSKEAAQKASNKRSPQLRKNYGETWVEIWHLDELPSALPASTLNLHQNEDEK